MPRPPLYVSRSDLGWGPSPADPADPDDGRASLLSPTDDAVAMIKGVTSARIQRFAAALDRLTDDQREALALSLPALETQLADE